MQYSKEDIVTVAPSRGSWTGIIIQVTTIGDRWAYLVQPLELFHEPEAEKARTAQTVLEDEIVSANRNYPEFSVGEQVFLFGLAGEIKSINGDIYRVKTQTPKRHYTQIRHHNVYRWQLMIWNSDLYEPPA
ncbi:hypothetical protein [Rhodohalobacter sulfatireducens]|uniref:Uncharacterized protein n=1 Tax=Rhodohalobacter sulfatireducens TaxID=2911366 RepID=A0ABS9KHT3_9BACT|nr:hypothetical protein [Rhodohalobacter sulfatireducens]MCG2590395.1 hypothetical protein [Rhodohalobacter sulfatireducens]